MGGCRLESTFAEIRVGRKEDRMFGPSSCLKFVLLQTLARIGEDLERSAAHLRGPQGVALAWLAGLMHPVHSLDLG